MNSRWRFARPVLREWCAILGTLSMLVMVATWQAWLWRVDQTLYDNALELLARPADSDIVIVGIDEEALAKIGRWPWRRDLHALLIDQLSRAGPKVIVLDLVLAEEERQFQGADEALAAAIRRSGKVVLPVTMHAEQGRIVGEARPAPLFAQAAAALSHVSVALDPDGILRSAHLKGGMGLARYDISPLAALRIAEPALWPAARPLPGIADTRKARTGTHWVQDAWYQIPFSGPPGHFRVHSYVDVLAMNEAALSAAFRGRFVLIGATAPALADAYPTPGSGANSRSMPGIEIQANLLQSLREGIDIRIAGVGTSAAIGLAFLLLTLLAFPFVAPRWSLVIALSVALASVVFSALLFRFATFWWSPAVTFLAVLLAYPLWSWRKLEATQRYLDEELRRLDNEPNIVPFEASKGIAPLAASQAPLAGLIETRIATVQAAAERMRSLNRFVAETVESLPDATLVTNAEGQVLLANSSADRLFKARRVKVDPASGRIPDRPLEGRDIIALLCKFSREGGANWRETWADAYDETRTVSFEATFEDAREFLIQFAPLFSTRGPQTGSIVILVDVSPLRESERRRDEALRFLSHDMRSPQASILTLLGMYRDDPEAMPVDKLVARVERYSRRTLNLADEFLRLARAERARTEDFETIDLAELVRDAVDEIWSSASAKRIRVDWGEHDEAPLRGDRDLLTRALINLLSNAVKYSPPDTTVSVRLRVVEPDYELSVADQGYGIAAEDLPKLFSRFQRLRHEAQPDEEGVGLGLVFVKTVVERHGGAIAVASRVAGAGTAPGTTFTLNLPRSGAPLEPDDQAR